MSQIDNLLNFVAGNTENRKVMSKVDDGRKLKVALTIDVFSWLLINCDLFTLNIDGNGNSVHPSSMAPDAIGSARSIESKQKDVCNS